MKIRTLLNALFATVVIIFAALIYWSSVLQEEDLKALRIDLKDIKNELESLKFRPLSHNLADSKNRPHLDDQYPNLLSEDPFIENVLPTLIGKDFSPQGIRKEALLGRPENLHPFNNFKDVSTLMGYCQPSVAQLKFGKYETMAPNLGIKMEARPVEKQEGVVEYWVHLRDGVYWQPLRPEQFPSDFHLSEHFLKPHPVTAHDFKFYYDAVMNFNITEAKAASLRNYYGDIEEFRVVDPLTFVVRWKTQLVTDDAGKKVPKIKYTAESLTGSLSPLPCFVYQYFADGQKIIDDEEENSYRTNSVFAQNFTHHFAKNVISSCGPWTFQGITDEGITLKRNNSYFDPKAVLVEGLHYTFKDSFDGIWQDFKAGNLDECTLAPNQIAELSQFLSSQNYQDQVAKGMAIHELDFVDKAFYYIGWNQATPYFNSKKVRLAMTYAIDRNRIIEQNLNGMGIPISGPFFRFSPSYDEAVAPWPYDPYTAKKLLDEEGWIDLNGDGIRDKMIDGKRVPFKFGLIYYSKNVSTKIVCDYVATALRDIGIDCELRGLDITDLSHAFDDKSFDAVYFGWSVGTPPEDPKQLWHSSGAKEKGSSNAIGFANKEVDRIIETLNYEYDKEKRIALYHAFHRIIHEEAPYTFLYAPKRRLLYRDYVKNLFIPRERQDLIPGADVSEPDSRVLWLSQF